MIYHVYCKGCGARLNPWHCSPGRRRQGAIQVDVDLDVFQRRSKRCEQLVGQWVEEQASDQGDVAGSCAVDRIASRLGQNCVGCPAVLPGSNTLSEAALTESAQLMRRAATFPTDQRGQVGHL